MATLVKNFKLEADYSDEPESKRKRPTPGGWWILFGYFVLSMGIYSINVGLGLIFSGLSFIVLGGVWDEWK